jgi:hypothetical protein
MVLELIVLKMNICMLNQVVQDGFSWSKSASEQTIEKLFEKVLNSYNEKESMQQIQL